MPKLWTTKTILDAVFSKNPEDKAALERLQAQVKRFEAGVWFKGFQDQNDVAKWTGVQHQPLPDDVVPASERVDIMALSSAGRTMLTLQRGDVMLTMVADEESRESRTGLHGIHGTEEDIERLVTDAILQWDANPKTECNRDISMAIAQQHG